MRFDGKFVVLDIILFVSTSEDQVKQFSFLYHFLHGICSHANYDFEGLHGLLRNLDNALVAFGSPNLAKLWEIRAIVRADIFVKSDQKKLHIWALFTFHLSGTAFSNTGS